MTDESSKPEGPVPSETESGSLSLIYRGGLSDRGILLLDEYTSSLEGWRELFQLLGEVYFHQFPELRHVRGSRLLKIEIAAERRGSWESVLIFTLGAMAGGIIGNRADAVAVWAFKKLAGWFRDAISAYVRKKSVTRDVTEVTSAFRILIEERGYLVTEQLVIQEEEMTLLPALPDEEAEPEGSTSPRIDRVQALAERVDELLQEATFPLEHSCERMSVTHADGSSMLEIGPVEREVISAPLTLPPPKRDWVKRRIKFERINRKTGRALFHFAGEDERDSAHYSKIVDDSVRKPGNRFTQAFNDDAAIEVWMRQTHPEPRRLNYQWEIRGDDPDDLPLFRNNR